MPQVGTWVPSSPLDPSPALGLARKSKYSAYSAARISDGRGQGGGAKSQMILGLQVSNPGTLLFPRGHFTQRVSDGLERVQTARCVFQSRVLRGRDYFSPASSDTKCWGETPAMPRDFFETSRSRGRISEAPSFVWLQGGWFDGAGCYIISLFFSLVLVLTLCRLPS